MFHETISLVLMHLVFVFDTTYQKYPKYYHIILSDLTFRVKSLKKMKTALFYRFHQKDEVKKIEQNRRW